MTDQSAPDQIPLSIERLTRALGERDLRILMLEETVAQLAARIKDLEVDRGTRPS